MAAQNSRLHRIASISKVITRLAIEQLLKTHKLSRETLVFPEIFMKDFSSKMNSKAELITVQHLMDHMVGTWPTTTRELDPMFHYHNLNQKLLIQAVLNEKKIIENPGS